MKLLRTLFIGLLALLALLFVGRNLLAKAAVSAGILAVTGLRASVASADVGIPNTAAGLRGLTIDNPSGFTDRTLIEIPEIFVDYDLPALLKGTTHLEHLRVHVETLTVIRNETGDLNVQHIKGLESGKPKPDQPEVTAGRRPEFQIDVLELKIGSVTYKDYTQSPPLIKTYAVNINERYERITNPTLFAGLIISRALVKTTIARLANFDVSGLQQAVTDQLRASAGKFLGTLDEGTRAAGDIGEQAVGEAQKVVEEARGTLKRLLIPQPEKQPE